MRMRWWLYFVVIFPTMFISKTAMCECREETVFPIPDVQIFGIMSKECTFPTIAEFRNTPRPKYGWRLDINIDKINDSAKDIYYFQHSARDSTTYFSLILPSEEDAIKVAEEFAGVPMSEFREDRTSRDYRDYIREGPERYGDKWETPYWNFKYIKRFKFYIEGSRFTAIDLDANRVYLRI